MLAGKKNGAPDAAPVVNAHVVNTPGLGLVCSFCDKPGASLKRCGNCKLAWYCDEDCQRADWKAGHKAVCRSDSLKQVNIDAKSLRVVRQHTESKNIARFVLDAIGARKALRGDSMHGMRVTVRSGADLLDGCSDVVG